MYGHRGAFDNPSIERSARKGRPAERSGQVRLYSHAMRYRPVQFTALVPASPYERPLRWPI